MMIAWRFVKKEKFFQNREVHKTEAWIFYFLKSSRFILTSFLMNGLRAKMNMILFSTWHWHRGHPTIFVLWTEQKSGRTLSTTEILQHTAQPMFPDCTLVADRNTLALSTAPLNQSSTSATSACTSVFIWQPRLSWNRIRPRCFPSPQRHWQINIRAPSSHQLSITWPADLVAFIQWRSMCYV